MTILKSNLESMLLEAYSELFREPVFLKHPDIEPIIKSDTKGTRVIPQRSFQKAVVALMNATNKEDAEACHALALLIANMELQAQNFYIINKTSQSYFSDFKNKASASSDSNEGLILMLSKENPILKQAIRGILLTSLTATHAYKTQEAAEKELNKLIPDDLFIVEDVNGDQFAEEGPIIERKNTPEDATEKTASVYHGESSYKGTLFGKTETTTNEPILVNEEEKKNKFNSSSGD
jgi:hypothetical protein